MKHEVQNIKYAKRKALLLDMNTLDSMMVASHKLTSTSNIMAQTF